LRAADDDVARKRARQGTTGVQSNARRGVEVIRGVVRRRARESSSPDFRRVEIFWVLADLRCPGILRLATSRRAAAYRE
jgi:hypothetical protein